MATNITIRLPWHMNGWNGSICKNPKDNTYCTGNFSYPGDLISKAKNEAYELKFAGQNCSLLQNPPPCALSCNAFGSKTIRCRHEPPTWFKGADGIWSDVPPYTVHIWPYEQMYADEVMKTASDGRSFNNQTRKKLSNDFFTQLVPQESILIYYANYSNPFSDEEKQRYIVIGIARLSQPVGEEMYFTNVSEEDSLNYSNGLVWQRSLTSDYTEHGMRIPYELYYENQEVLENIIIEPDNPRAFKYATREISDDDLITLVERLMGVADYLSERGDTSQNWTSRKDWMTNLLSDLWKKRGAYPGFPNVLNYLKCAELSRKYLNESRNNGSVEAYKLIKDELLKEPKMKRAIALKGGEKAKLLLDIIPRFDFTKEQIIAMIDKDGIENGISASVEEIAQNPYLLCEQYIGNNQDDVISFYQIDNGALPSPEYGIEKLTEADSAERFRALCVDALRWDNTHSFTPSGRVLDLVNHRVSKMRDWKKNTFSSEYFEVDREILSIAITFRTDEQNKVLYLYLNEVFEDERLVERTLKNLVERADIVLKQPIIAEKFIDTLLDNSSPLVPMPEYREAIQAQATLCAEVFCKGLCVISGAAGTGKTSLVSRIIDTIKQTEGAGVSIKLLAPTGKAAERIREKTGQSAATIHSLIASCGWLNNNMTFKRSGGKQEKDVNTIIIDETSMVDLSLLATLFRAIQWNNVKRLILVGDPNQLPPIGRGKVFSDTIEWLRDNYRTNVGELKYNIRQMENKSNDRGEGIVKLADILIQERQEKQNDSNKSKREEVLRDIQKGGNIYKDLAVHYWQTGDDLDQLLKQELIHDLDVKPKVRDLTTAWEVACQASDSQDKNPSFLQVLSPFRSNDYGTDRLNIILQSLLNNKWASKFMLGSITLFDKVIQVVNRPKSKAIYAYNWTSRKNEPIEVYNGDMGFVYPHGFDRQKRKYMFMDRLEHFSVKFKGKENMSVSYGKKLDKMNTSEDPADNLELAYAISVHKSQGSEFDIVYLVLPKRRSSTLSMELIYTAVTRAKRRLVLFIQEDITTLSCLTKIERSAVRRINSSVFKFKPLPEQLSYLPGHYEEYKVIATLTEYFVRSKSEALIANALHASGLDFSYEKPLFAPDGTMYLPDFTLTFQGNDYYWEHWGLLDCDKYASHTAKKKLWYEKHFSGYLIESIEGNDISTQIQRICKEKFGISL